MLQLFMKLRRLRYGAKEKETTEKKK